MKFKINVMTKNRTNALIEVLKAVSAINECKCNLDVAIFDSSSQEYFEKDKIILSQYPGYRHFRLAESNSMSENWEEAVREGEYDYVLTVTDRSILYNSVLAAIADAASNEIKFDVICWAWDVEINGGVLRYRGGSNGIKLLSENDYYDGLSYYGFGGYPYCLPRGLNAAISRKTVEKLRAVFGSVYSGINPDFGLAYKLLFINSKVGFINRSLFVSKFTELSNGGSSSSALNWAYVNTVADSKKILKKTHLNLPICSNTIFADILFVSESIIENKNITGMRRKLAFSASCSVQLEVKRFYARKLIDGAGYREALGMIKLNNELYESVPHSIKVIFYRIMVRIMPLFVLR